jgi:hypothetical protein
MRIRNVAIGLAVSALVTGIVVSCGGGGGGGGAATYTVSGSLAGATGNVTLKLNGANDMTQGNGGFSFPNQLGIGNTFNVQVVDAADRCTVANGAGTIGAANVTNVTVTCAAQGTEMIVRSAILNGAQEVPPTGVAGTGVGGVIVDPTTKAITGGVTFSGLTGAPTLAHIHRGDTSIAIGLVLASDNASAMLPAGVVLAPADYAELLAGTLYFNVHTAAHGGGEIRGNIILQSGVIAGVSSLDNAQEVPASTSTATGNGTVIVDRATGLVLTAYVTHNVASATAAHIHTSPTGPGSNGNVILGFPTLVANFDGAGNNLAFPPAGSAMNSTNLSDFLVNYLYFNVHSNNNLCAPAANCAAGEIRGNITAIAP